MTTITYRCRTEHCRSVLMLSTDDYLPPDWTCPACADAELAQQVYALSLSLTSDTHPLQEQTHEKQ